MALKFQRYVLNIRDGSMQLFIVQYHHLEYLQIPISIGYLFFSSSMPQAAIAEVIASRQVAQN